MIFILIEKYLNGNLISTFDIGGKKVDLGKIPKKSEKQLIEEGLLIITIIAEFE